jgi:ABC-2 type transport system permease protein
MSNLTNIIKKEVKELLTPTIILPVIIMAVVFGSMGSMIGGIEEEAKEKPVIGLIDEDNSTFSEIVANILNEGAEVVYNFIGEANVQEGLEKVEEKDGTALLIITSNFSGNILGNKSGVIEIHWIMKGAGILDSISSSAVEGLIQLINKEISKVLIEENTSMNSTMVLNPTTKNETTIFKGREMRGLSPGAISGMLSLQSIMLPIIIMMIIMMAGGTVISSMGMEKENKTLETLLTLPVKRSSIVAGKIVGSAVIGLMMAVIFMVGFSFYIQSLQTSFSSEINLADFGLTLDAMDYLLLGISVFIALLAGLSLCMVLGTFAKNYKSAQTLTMPISFLAIIPMFVIMFKDFDTLPLVLKGVVFAIPFSHPMMAMRSLMVDDYVLVIGGIAYVVIFAIVTIAVAVWIFNTDRLLTGKVKRKSIIKGKKIIWRKPWM